ncbi:hypothetical protein B0T11DRAFT_270117 [Plectosphaerella cucumerina]|uniref:Uncharacterized protein n=1 Tax=Plectosphaerella cucumerina TaxID=40658 RepID=A0A8K0X9T7_9PEZI|nr:hypothetical protein B0T11DRAFT_270117 [Plectosphaerella cucumerina]
MQKSHKVGTVVGLQLPLACVAAFAGRGLRPRWDARPRDSDPSPVPYTASKRVFWAVTSGETAPATPFSTHHLLVQRRAQGAQQSFRLKQGGSRPPGSPRLPETCPSPWT